MWGDLNNFTRMGGPRWRLHSAMRLATTTSCRAVCTHLRKDVQGARSGPLCARLGVWGVWGTQRSVQIAARVAGCRVPSALCLALAHVSVLSSRVLGARGTFF